MGIEATIDTPLARAVRAVGSQSAYARLVGLSQSSVHEALRDLRPVRDVDVLIVEKKTGIPRHELRVDLYPDESDLTARRLDCGAPAHDDLAPAR